MLFRSVAPSLDIRSDWKTFLLLRSIKTFKATMCVLLAKGARFKTNLSFLGWPFWAFH
jgi:hypothetical protein